MLSEMNFRYHICLQSNANFQRHTVRAHVKWPVRPVDLHHACFSMIRQRQCSLISATRPDSSILQLISALLLQVR